MFPLQKFTATTKWVNQLKQGSWTEPFVFDIGYNLKVEYIFGTRNKNKCVYMKKNQKKRQLQNILTSLTSNSHSCKQIPNKVKGWHTALTSKRIVTGHMMKKAQGGIPVKCGISHGLQTILPLIMLSGWKLEINTNKDYTLASSQIYWCRILSCIPPLKSRTNLNRGTHSS